MVNIAQRMTRLKELLRLKVGGGAAILPPEVTRLHMDFVMTYDDGHKGPRNFWRNDLRRLKFYNPAIPMTVSRTENPDDPALMTIHFASASAAASTPATPSSSPAPTERTEVFTIKSRKRYEILEQLMTLTNAKKIEPTEQELNEIRELSAKREQSAKDSALSQKVNARKKQEKRRMAIARGELTSAS
ncbi:hypothetical protein LHYA1_G000124 [Lachnellula hyalina]|uniref:Ribosomal protein/NADH dehydrogenase domain-containing protein n=1 Tax=Lachnellula hyalina TaxID=1316788 RepID=A0A8H8U2H4_9HELO|nr:uncharacterized protein LHYA1_G000124 [Lachnellula hyalina]TVY31170.1 hypothetical protein LHYA1_G000124 [Lachnellula hyalina]